jgi:dual oxidase maturation factor 1
MLFFRRLSSKTREQTLNDINRMGIENRGFQQEVPKSPWRYPFRRSQVPPMQRTISQDSTSTIASAANANAMAIPSSSTQSLRRETLSRMLPP